MPALYNSRVGRGTFDGARRKKYEVAVEEAYGETIVTARLPHSAELSYRRFCDAARIGARFTEIDTELCWIRYRLISERAHYLPEWDDELYESRPAVTVVLGFCDWLTP